MTDQYVVAFIGLLGVVIGSVITIFQTFWADRKERDRKARYLAIRLVCVLDKYLEDCLSVVNDDGLCCGQRTREGCLEPQVKSPGAPVLPSDVDWKSIDHALMYDIMSFPSDVEAADKEIASVDSEVAVGPDYDDFFEERSFHYAKFGLRVHGLASKLRKKYGIPAKDYGWRDPVGALKKELEEIEERRKRQQTAIQAAFAETEKSEKTS